MSANKEAIGSIEKIGIWLKKNNIDLSPIEFLIVLILIFTLPFLIGLVFTSNIILSLAFSAVFGTFFFIGIRFRARGKNLKKEEQLEQFLLDLNANLYSNQNIISGIEKSLKATEYPLRRDLEILIDEYRRGQLLKNCMENMAKRNSSQIIKIVMLGFIAANEKGVNLINFISSQIEYIRENKSFKNYVKVLTEGPKYTSYIIMVIPIISLILILLLNKNFLTIILSPAGLVVLIYSVISFAIGFLIINRMVGLNKKKE
ncbi:MAG: type II secretion system F family protein [Actinomycetota bacterium]